MSVTFPVWIPIALYTGNQKLTKRNKQKSRIKVATAANNRIRFMQQSRSSYLSKSFREMTNYTRFMYFMIYWRPSFCMFVFVFCFFYSSALILLFRSSNIHITSKPHSTKCTDTVCTNIIPV